MDIGGKNVWRRNNKMVLLNLTKNEYAYVSSVVEGCAWDSYQEDEGTSSLSKDELLRLLKKLGTEIDYYNLEVKK
jgi:hypothetical protein